MSPSLFTPGLSGLLPDDYLLILLALLILGLFAIAIAFTLFTFLLRRRSTVLERRRQQVVARWEPVILEVLAGTERPDALLDLVRPGEELPFLAYLSSYASRIGGAGATILRELAQPFLPVAKEALRRGGGRRAQAIRILGLFGMPEYAPVLVEALEDPSPSAAMIAAESLLRPGLPEHLEPVLARLGSFGRWHPSVLARLLADVGLGAAPVLRPLLTDSEQPMRVRAVVAQALRRIRDVESADLAADLIESEVDPDLLAESLRLLAEVGEARHRASLIPLLEAPAFHLRAQTLRALRSVGDSEDLPLFRNALRDPSPWVALEAARGVKTLGGEEELRVLAASESSRSILARQVLEE